MSIFTEQKLQKAQPYQKTANQHLSLSSNLSKTSSKQLSSWNTF